MIVRATWMFFLLVACDEAVVPSVDAGATPVDSGMTAVDSGSLPDDAGSRPDAGSDDPDAGPAERGLSAGCGNARAGRGVQNRTIEIAGVMREYIRIIPDEYDPDRAMALVIGLHGSGGTAVRARAAFDVETVAGSNAIAIYPQALPSTTPPFEGVNRWDPVAGSDDHAFLDALIAEVEASHCIDRDRIFAIGFSLGARFTSELGCLRGDVFRAIAPIAPGGNEGTLPLSGCVGEVAVWGGLGTRDAEHEEGTARVLEYYTAANGCAATRTPTMPAGCESYDGCRAEVPITWCTYDLGHEIPTFAPRAAWNFFRRFE